MPTETYGGDRAYDDTDIFERIEAAPMQVGIKFRRFRTTKRDAHKERWVRLMATPEYQTAIKLRYRLEQPFGQAKDKQGFQCCRSLGLLKFGIQAFITFMVVNAKRLMKLLTGITFRQLAKGRHREVFQPVYATLPWVSCVDRARGGARSGSLARIEGTKPPQTADRGRLPTQSGPA